MTEPTTSVPNETCGVVYLNNNSQPHLFEDEYAGIPTNLTINSCTWVFLLVLFTMLRRLAWDYGRIALVSRQEEKHAVLSHENRYNVWTSLFYGDGDKEKDKLHGSSESLDTHISQHDRGIFSWFTSFVKVKDADILKKCGKDAIHYLSFQRYLLLYTLIICILSCSIIIPINFTGENQGSALQFGHTTMANLASDSQLLWVHIGLGAVYLLTAVFMMRHFAANLHFEEDEQVTRTLMISNIPKEKCFKSLIMQHFQEAYTDIVIEDVQFAYNISTLIQLDNKRQTALEARINSEMELKKTGHRPTLRPQMCGQILCCGDHCGCREVDAINYYSEEEEKYRQLCEKEKVNAYREVLGIAFITFDSDAMAERVRADFHATCKMAHNPQPSSIHTDLNVVEWMVKFAPSPDNIYWDKLSSHGKSWWARAICINTFLVILLFFLTTPSIIITLLDKINYKEKLHSPVLIQFAPTLLLWTFTALLPNVIYYSDQYIGHWTRTAEHHSVMRKTYIFLMLMVLILPSLGLTSANALLQLVFDKNRNYRWQCIFLADNGAFFVNYIITSAFIGSGLELLRFSELFIYTLKLSLAKSSAERVAVRKHVLWEFQFGNQYAWMLCVFAVIVAYSISCPLIVPFGLVYMTLKHLVDRYNIYFAYKPSYISRNIHSTAVNYVIVAAILLQCNLVFFTFLRAADVHPIFLVATGVLLVTLLVFFGRICFGWFRNIGPLRYTQFVGQTRSEEPDSKPFVASVLLDKSSTEQNSAAASTGRQTVHNYGAIGDSEGLDSNYVTAEIH
ncbi:hypothetical protein ACJMK2_037336 [Sinanodonta woodiana]|uniref:CSC1-like protein 2 n=1 Tax=Sinanodonta woodiana TaxID=1069815 RepID=A0ABD3WNJ4_SINWO